jgi:P4 family phage/plasmid primase-like protien
MDKFLKQYEIKNGQTEKPITHTSMKGGKWSIPAANMPEFYKLTKENIVNGPENKLLVEKMHDYFPFVIDIDLKYKSKLEERQYNEDTITKLIELLWSKISESIKIDDISGKGVAFLMEKEKPYPCDKQGFKSKDGIHLAFPELIVNKQAFKKIIHLIQESNKIKEIFNETCISFGPDNEDKQILDSSFSSWQLYGCGKDGESPYLLTKVFKISQDNYPEEIDEDEFKEFYTDPIDIMESMSMCYRKEGNVEYHEEFMKTLKQKGKKKSSSAMTNNNDDNIYGNGYYVDNNNVINPFKIVLEEELKLVKNLVKCLSKERASDYGKWFDVALCLHNININLLDSWKLFSSQVNSYDPNECDSKWNSINNSHSGVRLGIGSLMFWAKNDNEKGYIKAKEESLSTFIHKSVTNGADADYLVSKVIYEYYKDEFISVNVKDEWFHFNGSRWERTLEGTILKTRIHNDIYNIYNEYENNEERGYRKKMTEAVEATDDPDEKQDIRDGKTKEGRWLKNILAIKMKLLQGNYVNGLMKNVRDLFYKKEIMEKFDTDTSLLGFDNGIYDLKNNVFREGRPEDYVTMTTRVSLPVKKSDMPIKLDDMIQSFNTPDLEVFPEMKNYNRFYDDMNDFIDKIVPLPGVRDYTLKFLAKCFSGDNRDEGFYIWTGTGGNGKSKLIDLMSMCLGSYACNLPIALLTQKRKASGAASPEMAITCGKRLAVMQEPDVNETLNIGQMKEITGNDKISARGLYKEPFEFTPQFKLVCMCNDLPNIPSNDDGTWRRLEVVDFIARFVDYQNEVDETKHRHLKDKSIKSKIPMWVIPFYALLLPHWREYDENGIDIPDEVKAKTNEYRNNNDLIGQWIRDNCVEADNEISTDGITETAPTDFDTLYDDFKEWCGEEELKNILDKGSVRNSLKKWQEKSRYGLSYGKNKSEAGANGYEKAMKFNLKTV